MLVGEKVRIRAMEASDMEAVLRHQARLVAVRVPGSRRVPLPVQ